jgi:hypothetical protein
MNKSQVTKESVSNKHENIFAKAAQPTAPAARGYCTPAQTATLLCLKHALLVPDSPPAYALLVFAWAAHHEPGGDL